MKFTPLLILISSLLAASLSAEESEFQTTTIDLGVMVGDLEKSIQFYTEAVGFSVVGGFTADSQVVKDSGLGDGEALVIKTLALGKEKGATKIKLMQAKESPRKGSQTYITSQLGFRYLTIHVKNMDVSVTRLKKAGVKILAKG
ncbi:MAG: VOC family protein, partial [Akkermansiaceae bacterium]